MQGSSVFSHNFCPFSTSFLSSTSTTHTYSHFRFKPTILNPRDSTRVLTSHFASSSRYVPTPRRRLVLFKVRATAAAESDQPEWWEKNTPNMVDVHSTQDFLDVLSQAGDRLVIVDFYGTWCASCRALFPKLCKIAVEYPEILFMKVNFDENKSLCKSLNIKVLPFFHFYRGADGLLDSFSCSLAKIQKLKDAIASYNPADTKENSVRGNGGGDSQLR